MISDPRCILNLNSRQAMAAYYSIYDALYPPSGGGAGLLLPDALEVFPHRPTPLLALCAALSKAGPESCDKVRAVSARSEKPYDMLYNLCDHEPNYTRRLRMTCCIRSCYFDLRHCLESTALVNLLTIETFPGQS